MTIVSSGRRCWWPPVHAPLGKNEICTFISTLRIYSEDQTGTSYWILLHSSTLHMQTKVMVTFSWTEWATSTQKTISLTLRPSETAKETYFQQNSIGKVYFDSDNCASGLLGSLLSSTEQPVFSFYPPSFRPWSRTQAMAWHGRRMWKRQRRRPSSDSSVPWEVAHRPPPHFYEVHFHL